MVFSNTACHVTWRMPGRQTIAWNQRRTALLYETIHKGTDRPWIHSGGFTNWAGFIDFSSLDMVYVRSSNSRCLLQQCSQKGHQRSALCTVSSHFGTVELHSTGSRLAMIGLPIHDDARLGCRRNKNNKPRIKIQQMFRRALN